MRVALISDTHGLLRDEALAALQGSDHILHAGDIGDPAILETLARIAPISAVRGNNDHGDWAAALPETRVVRLGDVAIYLLHDLKELASRPPAGPVDVVVSGHSHAPGIERREDGLLLVNPGSAGRRRFRLPVTVGQLLIDGRDVQARILELQV